MNMQKMLKDLQKMQSKMTKAQTELQSQSFEAEAGGGMVKVVINGQGVMTAIKISPDAVDKEDVEALEDLLWQPSMLRQKRKKTHRKRA
jgi:DNA-binding YbaB/EbfC family protein